jgi:hypothetical protein
MFRIVRMTSFNSRPNLLEVHLYILVGFGITRQHRLILFRLLIYTVLLRPTNAMAKYLESN